MRLLCLIFASFSLAAAGQTSFRAFDSSEDLIEGGTVYTLVVEAGREHLVTRIPRGYAATVDNRDPIGPLQGEHREHRHHHARHHQLPGRHAGRRHPAGPGPRHQSQ